MSVEEAVGDSNHDFFPHRSIFPRLDEADRLLEITIGELATNKDQVSEEDICGWLLADPSRASGF